MEKFITLETRKRGLFKAQSKITVGMSFVSEASLMSFVEEMLYAISRANDYCAAVATIDGDKGHYSLKWQDEMESVR